MDFRYSDADEQYRQRLRVWLKQNLPGGWGPHSQEPEEEEARVEFRRAWDQRVYEGGYSGITWPRNYGGQGGTSVQHAIYLEESARANAPMTLNIIGRNIAAPLLLAHGTEDQRQRFIPKIATTEEVWCQGFSEPGAGSDLASLRTRAELKGDRFVINGQKIWTSWAYIADWCLLLVRTDPEAPKHKGLSFILVKLDTPGITIRQIKRITGHNDFTEIFFDNVEVPAENLIGEINKGWQIAMATLGLERGPEEQLARQVRFRHQIDLLISIAAKMKRGGRAVIESEALRQKLAASLIEIELMRLNCLRGMTTLLKKGEHGPEALFNKLYWSHMNQRLAETSLEIEGVMAPLVGGDPDAIADGLFQFEFLWSRAATIYSGTSEIQRNIVAERLLGLPR
jgi:alkylation response protein AidB-like acyl-CoA dehydrogenase